jgi:hypothetical protein
MSLNLVLLAYPKLQNHVISGGFATSSAFEPDELQSMLEILPGFPSCAKRAEP